MNGCTWSSTMLQVVRNKLLSIFPRISQQNIAQTIALFSLVCCLSTACPGIFVSPRITIESTLFWRRGSSDLVNFCWYNIQFCYSSAYWRCFQLQILISRGTLTNLWLHRCNKRQCTVCCDTSFPSFWLKISALHAIVAHLLAHIRQWSLYSFLVSIGLGHPMPYQWLISLSLLLPQAICTHNKSMSFQNLVIWTEQFNLHQNHSNLSCS